MNTSVIQTLHRSFEEAAYEYDGIEYWLARDLQKLLGYANWQNFENVIEKAKMACENSSQDVSDHFIDISKMVKTGSEAERKINDVMLTRYSCYLIAQNGDPRKEVIAFAQSYFAIQTRKQELLEERIRQLERLQAREKLKEAEDVLSSLAFERGIDNLGFARIKSKGDKALFGGHTTSAMKKKLGLPAKRGLADFLPTLTIAAKNFATELTNYNVVKDNLQGEKEISDEHISNNTVVRNSFIERGIHPEELPADKDIKKVKKALNQYEENVKLEEKKHIDSKE